MAKFWSLTFSVLVPLPPLTVRLPAMLLRFRDVGVTLKVSLPSFPLSDVVTPDAVLTDTEEALNALGELTGKTVREDLVATIFARFCVGK